MKCDIGPEALSDHTGKGGAAPIRADRAGIAIAFAWRYATGSQARPWKPTRVRRSE